MRTVFIYIAVVVFLVGIRVFEVPFGVNVIVSGSMYPTIDVGDLVVIVSINYNVGDIVMWCSTPTYCVVHRVVNISYENRYVVTQGDANPIPDNPVSMKAVRGKVIAIIPKLYWIPAVSIILGYLIISGIRSFFRIPREALTELIPTYLSLVMAFTVILTVYSSTLMLSYESNPIRISYTYLARGYIVDNTTTAVIDYTNSSFSIRSIIGCLIFHANESHPCMVINYTDRTVVIDIDRDILYRVNLDGTHSIYVKLDLKMTRKAVINGSLIKIPIFFKDIKIDILPNAVRIYNPNPIPIPINISILYADKPGEQYRVNSTYTDIQPFAEIVVEKTHRYQFLDITYIVNGNTRYSRINMG